MAADQARERKRGGDKLRKLLDGDGDDLRCARFDGKCGGGAWHDLLSPV